MKITEGHMVLLKLACFLGIPLLTPFVDLLKPHAEKGDWPNSVSWTITLFLAGIGICNAGLAFTSNSFSKWMEKRKPEGDPK
jgi:hypothetical protein